MTKRNVDDEIETSNAEVSPRYMTLSDKTPWLFGPLRVPPSGMVRHAELPGKEEVVKEWRAKRARCAKYIGVSAAAMWLVISVVVAGDFASGFAWFALLFLPLTIISLAINYRLDAYVKFENDRRYIFFMVPALIAICWMVYEMYEPTIKLWSDGRWFAFAMSVLAAIALPVFYTMMMEAAGLFSKGLLAISRLFLAPGFPLYAVPVSDMNSEFTDWVKVNHKEWVASDGHSIIDLNGMRDVPDKVYLGWNGIVGESEMTMLSRSEFREGVIRKDFNEQRALALKAEDARKEEDRIKLDALLSRSARTSPLRRKD